MSEKASAPDSGRIFLGILAIVVWVVVHLVLFYLFFASGFFIDLAIRMLRAIFMNDAPALSSMSFAWATPLQIGLILTGLAGVSGGAAIFWNEQRRTLLWTFCGAFVIGVLFEIFAVFSLFRAAFSS